MKENPLVQDYRCAEGPVVVRGASCVLTMDVDLEVVSDSTAPQRLGAQRDVDIVLQQGRIEAIGPRVGMEYEGLAQTEVDGRGLVVMPGLVDASATPCYRRGGGLPTVLRSQGLSDAELRRMGASARDLQLQSRIRSSNELREALARFQQGAMLSGVALQTLRLEAQSDIGRTLGEWETLCEFQKDSNAGPLARACFGGLHAGALENSSGANYLDALLAKMPQIRSAVSSQRPPLLDVEMDREQVTKDLADRFLSAALQYGFDVSLRGDWRSRCGAAELAGGLADRLGQVARSRSSMSSSRVLSVVHATYSSDADLARLARSGVAVVVTPSSDFHDASSHADANRLRAAGVRLAIASGFHALSSPLQSLWFGAYLALREGHFSLPEVLCGVTREAAFALGCENDFGRIRPGHSANLLAFEGGSPEAFFDSPLGDHLKWVIRP